MSEWWLTNRIRRLRQHQKELSPVLGGLFSSPPSSLPPELWIAAARGAPICKIFPGRTSAWIVFILCRGNVSIVAPQACAVSAGFQLACGC